MSQPYTFTPKTDVAGNSIGQEEKASTATIIQSAFGRLENAQERLMKAASTLISRIQPVLRNDPPSPAAKNVKDPTSSPVPLAQRLDEMSITLENLAEQIHDTVSRVEL